MSECAECGQQCIGDDPCIGSLPGVRHACCGHGNPDAMPYLTLDSDPQVTLYGSAAVTVMRAMGGNPPDYSRSYSAALVTGGSDPARKEQG